MAYSELFLAETLPVKYIVVILLLRIEVHPFRIQLRQLLILATCRVVGGLVVAPKVANIVIRINPTSQDNIAV